MAGVDPATARRMTARGRLLTTTSLRAADDLARDASPIRSGLTDKNARIARAFALEKRGAQAASGSAIEREETSRGCASMRRAKASASARSAWVSTSATSSTCAGAGKAASMHWNT